MKKPLMTVGCEEIVTSRVQELQMRIEWLEKGLKEIYKSTTIKNIQDTITSILDGEPTTADPYNNGDDIEYYYE